jgi:hypothetical protein
LVGEQSGQGAVVAVQIKSLPLDAALVEPARAGGGFDAFAHVSFGLHGQYQAMFRGFHISVLNRYWFFGLVVVGGVGMENDAGSPADSMAGNGLLLRGRRAIALSQKR